MNCIGVLLAAGHARRFGSDKLLAATESGEPVGLRSARRLISQLPDSVAVVREEQHHLREILGGLGFRLLTPGSADAGMGDNLALAVRETPAADAWLITLADMPWVSEVTLRRLITSLRADCLLCAPVHDQNRGHPVGFSQRLRAELLAISGDRGARDLIVRHQHELVSIPVDDPGVRRDVDIPDDLTDGNPL